MVLKFSSVRFMAATSVLLAMVGLGVTGCEKKPADPEPAPAVDDHGHSHEDGHGHDEDHGDHEGEDGHHEGHAEGDHDDHAGHDHTLGPNGGHFADLEPAGIEAEWVILDEGKELQVFFPESAPEVSAVTFQVTLGDEKLPPYSFKQNKELGVRAWRLADPALFNHVKMTADKKSGVKVSLVATSGDKESKAVITHHQH